MDVYPTISLKGERWYTERLLELLLLKNEKYPSISSRRNKSINKNFDSKKQYGKVVIKFAN
jgi:hypothetical protein